jgi:hypothetical protein
VSVVAHEIDQDVGRLVLDVVDRKVKGPGVDARIDHSLTGGEIERTITGASTLTLIVHDPKRVLLASGMFDHTIEVTLDGLNWRLVKLSKADDDLTLTFEDRAVSYLREVTTPKKASRSAMTRAEFAYSLVREVKKGGGIEFICPELHVKQAIETDAQKKKHSTRKQNRDPGLNILTPNLTVKGVKATPNQIKLAERALDVADSLNAPDKARVALVEAIIVESVISNPSTPSADGYGSRGILQVRDVTAAGMHITNTNVEQCVNAFLTRGFYGQGGAIELARKHPDWSAGKIAQACQGSGYGSRYDEHTGEAQGFVSGYGGAGAGVFGADPTTIRQPFQFRRGDEDGTKENSWNCLVRLAEEVNWRCFVSKGALYFISDDTLMKAKAALVLTETSPGVVSIDFDIDQGKVNDEVTIRCRASRWLADPGAVVQIDGVGPADGRWLVSDLYRDLFDPDATITLVRPSKKFLEPAAAEAPWTEAEPGGYSRASKTELATVAGDKVAAVYAAARSITDKHFPYVWGGGHAHVGTPDRGTGRDPGIGYDCSGSVCAALSAGGLGYQPGDSADDSGRIARSWGEPGPGKNMTVYANAGHVFMVFHNVGRKGDEHFGTGDFGSDWNGPGLKPQLHWTAGFTARHWPGT